MDDFKNKRVTVAGLGHFGGGIQVSKWLISQGARVLVTDKETAEKLADSIAKLAGLPIEFRLGEHRESDFTSCDLLVISPAVPPSNLYLQAAKNAGVPITTEIRLLIERCVAPIVGITGTKGKSTTSKLLHLMLEKKYRAWLGGNIGGSLLEKLPEISDRDIVVLELSSYMLEHLRPMKWSPHVAVLTMTATDHLEWHGSAEAYIDAKKNIVRFQTADDFAVLPHDAIADQFAKITPAKIMRYSLEKHRLLNLTVAGQHNQLNAQAALAAAEILGVSFNDAQAAVKDFHGLPHRLELVHESNGVKYFNDSIATIPEAAIAALRSFPSRRVIQIVGGYDKHLPIDAMCAALNRHAKAVLCIGAIGPAIAEKLRAEKSDVRADIFDSGDLPTAMRTAKSIAKSGDVVLLSTGCASYDQFVNFEARGEMFTKLARETSSI